MLIKNLPARWAAWNVGGNGSPQRTLTVKVPVEISDMALGGPAEVLERWPLLQSALRGEHATKLHEPADALLGGGEHIVRVWGMEASLRHAHSAPLLKTQAAYISGFLVADVDVEDGHATATVTMKLKAPSGAWETWDPHETDKLGGTDIWVDIESVQTDIDDVQPTLRPRED